MVMPIFQFDELRSIFNIPRSSAPPRFYTLGPAFDGATQDNHTGPLRIHGK